jgi:hypothetical protein
MKDGGWLDKYQEDDELPIAQVGTNVPKTFGRGVAASESTGVIKPAPVLLKSKEQIKREAELEKAKLAAEVAKRQTYLSADTKTPELRAALREGRNRQDYINNSQLAQSLEAMSTTPGMGAIAAQTITEMNPIMSAVRLTNSLKDPANNPYGIGPNSGVVGNALGVLGVVGDVTDFGNMLSPAAKMAGSYLDQAIYPTRTYRASVPGGNPAIYEGSGDLANKVFSKGDWTTKDLRDAVQYLSGSEAQGARPGLLTGQNMNFTEYKVPFWKKSIASDPDVIALKKLQGDVPSPDEYIIPNNKFLYPRRTNTIQAVPENVKAATIENVYGEQFTPYEPGKGVLSYSDVQYSSPAYKYVEDQINAVTGQEMPYTFDFGDFKRGISSPSKMYDWQQPQFAPNAGIGKFSGLGDYLTTQTPLANAYKINPFAFKPNPEAYYRMIGKEGYKDILESGVLRANPGKSGLKSQVFDDVYFSIKHPWDGRNYGYVTKSGELIGGIGYQGPYMAELTGQELNTPISSFPRANMAQSKTPISVENPGLKLYKQDWLQGYKKLPKKENGGWLDKFDDGGELENSFDNVKASQFKPINQGTVNSIKNEMASYINSPLYAQRQAMHPEEYIGNIEYDYKNPKFFQESAADAKRSYRLMDLMNQPSEIKNIGRLKDYYDPTKKKTVLNKSNLESVVAHELGHSLFTKHDIAEMYSDYDNSMRWDALSSGKEKPFLTSLNKAEVKKFKDFAYPIKNWDEHYDKDMWGEFANESYADLTGIRHLLYKNGITKSFGEKINKGILDEALKIEQIKNDPTFKRMQQKYSPGKIILLNNTIAQNNSPQQEITQAEYGAELNYNDYSVSAPEGFQGDGYSNVGRNYSPAWGGQFAMGGSMPGAVGFTYARTNSPAPSNGPYAKKTMASAQNGIKLDDVYSKWPALKNMGPSALTANSNLGNGLGYGGVEFMHPDLTEVNYDNGTLVNPTPGKNSIIYNPSTEDEQNIRLDMLHGMHQDPKFNQYREQFKQSVLGDSELNADINYWYNIDKEKGRAEDGKDQYTDNYIDGQMRTLLYEGDRKLHNYSDEEANDLHDREDVRRSIHKMQNYLESGDQDKIHTGARPEFLTNLHKLSLPEPKYQNGGKMTYYQNGLDFEPKSISKNGSKIIKDDRGQWAHPGEITKIGSNQITMQGVPYPVLGISDTGDTQMMYPDQEYQYDGESVTEYPMMKEGGGLQLTKLDQLLNFTNYNNKQPGGWLDKYEDGGTVEADETTQTTQTTQTPDQKPNISKWLPKDPYDTELDPNYVKPKVTKKKPAVVQNTNRAPAPAKPQVNVTPNRQTAKGLNFEQIPTADKKKVIIDNYSDKYDYIVEGDKTYYRVKGGKSWDDISDNKTAQKNLLQFIDKNNYWSGYGSGEKDLLYPKTNTKKSTTAAPTKESSYFDNIINGTKKAITDNVINPLSNFSNAASKEVTKLKKSAGSVVDDVVNSVKSGTNSAIKSTDDIGQTIMNGVNRKLKMYTGVGDDDVEVVEPVSKIPKTIKEWYANSGGSSTVIEAKDQSGRQYKQQILPISSITFGSRNRDELKDINTEGMEITTFAPFDSNKKLPDNKTVLAIDQNGKLHTGMYKDFKNKKGFKVSETFMNKIVDLPDNQYKSAGPDNPGYKHPVAKVIDDNGKLVDGSINLLVKDPSKKNFYGSIQGGRVLFVNPSTKEQYLISGSAQHIRDAFKQLKGDNKYLEAYTLDNGTYARGLSYKDGKLTKERLAAYDKENTSGGNGLYIITNTKPVNKYQESYIDNMPNIRTEKSESFKRGHAVKNEIKNIILHHTAYTDAESNDRQLHQQYMTPNNNSSHVVIEEDGKRTIYASPEQVTYHAGESKWNNRSNVNDFGIGVEFQGDTNKRPLTQKQIESFVEYYTPIARKYNLSLKDIITHQMIAPGRKPDITNKEYKRILSYMKSKNFK